MDPPWKVNLQLKYPVLSDKDIMSIPFETLQQVGYIFCWILDQKEEKIKEMFKQKGYAYKGRIVWEKLTHKGNPVNGSGVTLRHSTESCYIFAKGPVSSISNYHKAEDLIRAQVRGESVKPEEIYDRINTLVPYGHKIEIFGRRHNVRKNFVTIGNQL
jgi:mRNA (2'-O-methyladenosine-N6-)-methyltransferase